MKKAHYLTSAKSLSRGGASGSYRTSIRPGVASPVNKYLLINNVHLYYRRRRWQAGKPAPDYCRFSCDQGPPRWHL